MIFLFLLISMASGLFRSDVKPTKSNNDGVFNQQFVTYLSLQADQGVKMIPGDLLLPSLDQEIDFTLMFWIKPLENFTGQRSLFQIGPKGIWCEIREMQLTCGGSKTVFMMSQLNIISVDLSKVPLHMWYHITFSSHKDQGSYLMISDSHETISFTEGDHINFSQTSYFWEACIGQCDATRNGFKAGIREVLLFGEYISPEIALQIKNQNLGWPQNTILYYKFDEAKFLEDQVWPNTAEVIGALSKDTVKAKELLIQDICPISGDVRNFYPIGDNYQTSFQPLRLGKKWTVDQKDYQYSISMKIMPTHHWCHMQDPIRASELCSIWQLREVAMLYKTAPDRARFYFFAKNIYEESYSKEFEFPQGQWVTIQLKMSKMGGYEIKTFDVFGRMKFHESVQRMMPEQQPQKMMDMFQNFRGYASHFVICKTVKLLPFTDFADCELAYNFEEADPSKVVNSLPQAEAVDLIWANSMITTHKKEFLEPKFIPEYKNYNDVTFQVKFDGLTCSDGHQVLKTQTSKAFMEAKTDYGLFKSNIPGLQSEDPRTYSAITVEFWVKFQDLKANRNIFSIANVGLNNQIFEKGMEYMIIDTNAEGQVRCRPFGDQAEEMEVIYKEFDQKDKYEWFHVMCKFQGGKNLVGGLYNTKVDKKYEYDVSESQLQLPYGKYKVRVGQSFHGTPGIENMSIKEIKVWNEFREDSLIKKYRYNQLELGGDIDLNYLQVYLMLARDDYHIDNLAFMVNKYIPPDVAFTNFEYISGDSGPYIHIVCPPNTYFNGKECLANPLKHFELLTSTQLNDTTGELDWVLEVKHFSFIANDRIFEYAWKFDNPVLNYLSVQNAPSQTFPSRSLVMESNYNVTVSIVQDELRIDETLNFIWIPIECRQMEIETKVERVVGSFDKDVELVYKMGDTKCLKSNYFDKLKVANVSYQVDEDENVYDEIPEIKIDYKEDGRIGFIIPMEEQLKFPFHKNISFIISFYWTNTDFEEFDIIPYEETIFQNTQYVLKFSPEVDFVIPKLSSSFNGRAFTNETMVFNASNSKIIFAEKQDLEHFWLNFTWQCDVPFALYCSEFDTQNLTSIDIPYSTFVDVGAVYNTNYTVTLTLLQWDKFGMMQTHIISTPFTFEQIIMPSLKIKIPDPTVLVSTNNDQFIELDDDPNIIEMFVVFWKSLPQIGQQLGTKIWVQKHTLQEQQKYDITAVVKHSKYQRVQLQNTEAVYTSYAPRNGIMVLEPKQGELGQEVTASIMYWDFDGPYIEWRIWSTTESGELDTLISPDWIEQEATFVFTAESLNPLSFEIRDRQGECSYNTYVTNFTAPAIEPLMLISMLDQPQEMQTKYAYMRSGVLDQQTFDRSLKEITYDISASADKKLLDLQIETLNYLLEQYSYPYNMDILVNKIRVVSDEYLQDFHYLDSIVKLLGKAQITTPVLNQFSEEILSAMCENVQAINLPMVINHPTIQMVVEKLDKPQGIWEKNGKILVNTDQIFENLKGKMSDQLCFKAMLKSTPDNYDTISFLVQDSNNRVFSFVDLNSFSTIELPFTPRLSTFKSNQTVCMSYIFSRSQWSADYCQTSYLIQEKQIVCSCLSSEMVTVLQDRNRERGGQVWNEKRESKSNGIQTVEYFVLVIGYLAAQLLIFRKQVKENVQIVPDGEMFDEYYVKVQRQYLSVQGEDVRYQLSRQQLQEMSVSGFPNVKSMLSSLHFTLGMLKIGPKKSAQTQYMKLMEYVLMLSVLRIYLFIQFDNRDIENEAFGEADLIKILRECVIGLILFQPWISMLTSNLFNYKNFRYAFAIFTNLVLIITIIVVSFSRSLLINKYCQWVVFIFVPIIHLFILDPLRIGLIYALTYALSPKYSFNQVAYENIERHEILKKAIQKVAEEPVEEEVLNTSNNREVEIENISFDGIDTHRPALKN